MRRTELISLKARARRLAVLSVAAASLATCALSASEPEPAWPEITSQTKPWTRWWWMGNSVDAPNLTAELEALKEIGIGGVEITPIYGVAGYEDRFVPFLSPEWMRALDHTLKEASRLGLGVDMATGTGWPFGGPWVESDDACKYVAVQTYTLNGGERLESPITFTQRTVLRAVGNQVYQLYGDILRPPGETITGSTRQPQQRPGAQRLNISELVEPISANTNLQALALDQVRFPKPLPLQLLMAYSDSGRTLNLTRRVQEDGRLDWTAPPGTWTLYAVFQGWHGKMVERAAPGGEGNVIDHFSTDAIRKYLRPFDRAFRGHDIRPLRAFFNDSYEVDDASGEADWTPDFFGQFRRRRGYDLREHLPALFGKDSADKNARVLCDYRETISELLLETFTREWHKWAHEKRAIVRNQAHGSPGNLLDLYAASDIPETEGTDLLRIKMASSAAHVSGKPLTAAESATWLNEHFRSTLWDVKQALDTYFLGGVNHVVYHGTCYSPTNEPWPGWLFYAAVHFNSRNSWWRDFQALNDYVARTQSFLQSGKPDNDVLLYFPISDTYSQRGNALLHHFDGTLARLEGDAFKQAATTLQERGYTYDFISDRQLRQLRFTRNGLEIGGNTYRALVVPQCSYIPLETFERVCDLAKKGAPVIFFRGLPRDVAGYADLVSKQKRFKRLLETVKAFTSGSGPAVIANDIERALSAAGIGRESMVDAGLQFVRRRNANETIYFVANRGQTNVNAWVPLQANGRSAAVYDPMRFQSGIAPARATTDGRLEVHLELAPGESCVVRALPEAHLVTLRHFKPSGPAQRLNGEWRLTFTEGGPELPPAQTLSKLGSWTELGDAAKAFSGTARYSITFPRPAGGRNWRLNLGDVRESARVRLNGRALGILIGPPFEVDVPEGLLGETNTLKLWVSNLMANRIADMDRRHVPWKKFYNVNVAARLAANRGASGLFDASRWEPLPSGLLGPVTLIPVEAVEF